MDVAQLEIKISSASAQQQVKSLEQRLAALGDVAEKMVGAVKAATASLADVGRSASSSAEQVAFSVSRLDAQTQSAESSAKAVEVTAAAETQVGQAAGPAAQQVGAMDASLRQAADASERAALAAEKTASSVAAMAKTAGPGSQDVKVLEERLRSETTAAETSVSATQRVSEVNRTVAASAAPAAQQTASLQREFTSIVKAAEQSAAAQQKSASASAAVASDSGPAAQTTRVLEQSLRSEADAAKAGASAEQQKTQSTAQMAQAASAAVAQVNSVERGLTSEAGAADRASAAATTTAAAVAAAAASEDKAAASTANLTVGMANLAGTAPRVNAQTGELSASMNQVSVAEQKAAAETVRMAQAQARQQLASGQAAAAVRTLEQALETEGASTTRLYSVETQLIRARAQATAEAQKQAAATQQSSAAAQQNSSWLTTLATRAAAAAAAYLSFRQAVRVFNEAVQARILLERLSIGLKSVAGDAMVAADAEAFLLSESQRLGLGLESTVMSFVKMSAAFTQSGFSFKQAEKIFTDLSIATKALGMSSAVTGRILYDFQEMASMGEIRMRQLRMVLMQVPGALSVATKAMNMTGAEFHRAIREGMIDPVEFITKFTEELANRYRGALPEAMETTESHINRLKNAWVQFLAELEKTTPFNKVVESLTSLLENLRLATALIEAKVFKGGKISEQDLNLIQEKVTTEVGTTLTKTVVEKVLGAFTGVPVEAPPAPPPPLRPGERINPFNRPGEFFSGVVGGAVDRGTSVLFPSDVYAQLEKHAQRVAASEAAAARQPPAWVPNEKQLEALDEIKKIETEINESTLTGLDLQVAKIHRNAEEQIADLEKYYSRLGVHQDEEQRYYDTLAIRQAEDSRVRTVREEASAKSMLSFYKEQKTAVDELADVRIQLIPDDEARRVAEVNKQFDELYKKLLLIDLAGGKVSEADYRAVEAARQRALQPEQLLTPRGIRGEARQVGAGMTAPELIKSIEALKRQLNDQDWIATATVDDFRSKTEQMQGMLDALTRKFEAGAVGWADAMSIGFKRTVDAFGNFSQQMATIGEGIASSMSENLTKGLVDMAEGTKRPAQAFHEMTMAILQDILRIAIQQLIVNNILRAFSAIGGAAAGAAGAAGSAGGQTGGTGAQPSAWAPAGSSTFFVPGGVHHQGGRVGEPYVFRMTEPAAWAGAARKAMAGFAGDEVPVVAHRGEVILKESDFRSVIESTKDGGGKKPVQIINVTDPALVGEFLAANPGAVLNVIQRSRQQVRHLLGVRS